MFNQTFNLNGMFGKLGPGMCRLSANGGIAVKTSHGYKTYNPETGRLVNCTQFCLDLGDELFFCIPVRKVQPGYIILVNGLPRCVKSVGRNEITVLTYETNTIETVVPERHVFMGNTYFYSRIMSPLGGMFGKKGGMSRLMKMMMLSRIMGGKASADGKSAGEGAADPMANMMMMGMMMGGKDDMFGDMFEGMFDEADGGLLAATDDDDEDGTDGDDGGVTADTAAGKKGGDE